MDNRELGAWGEKKAAGYLRLHGYKIIEMNCRFRQGEIDIIAKDKDEYVFIEVKTRQNFNYGIPSEAVDERKQKHIWNATQYYIYSHNLENKYIRIDVIEVYKKKNKLYLNHIKQIK